MPVLVSAGQATVPTYALLDSGATCNAITESLTLQIEAPVETTRVKLATFSEETTTERPIASFKVTDLNRTTEMKIENALVGEIHASKAEFPNPKITQRYPHLKNISFPTLEDKTVGIIIGTKFAPQWLTGKIVKGKNDEPFCLYTPFGPALVGPMNNENEEPNEQNVSFLKLLLH